MSYMSTEGLYTVRNDIFNELKCLEREPLRYCKGDGKVTFTRPNIGQGDL